MRRNIIGEDGDLSCLFCQNSNESVIHSLFRCLRVDEIWKTCYAWLGVKIAFRYSVDEHYWQYRIPLENTAWVLWNNRNSIVFNGGHFDKQKIVQEIMFQSWTWIKEFDKSFSYSFVQWSMNSGLCLLGQ